MRIAHIAPVELPVDSDVTNSVGQFIFDLAYEQARTGHDVTVFCGLNSFDNFPYGHNYGFSYSRADTQYDIFQAFLFAKNNFDIAHFHTDLAHYELVNELRKQIPCITTKHFFIHEKNLDFEKKYSYLSRVAVSHSQRYLNFNLNWRDVIHPGIPKDRYNFIQKIGCSGFIKFAFLARNAPEKGLSNVLKMAHSIDESHLIIAIAIADNDDNGKKSITNRLAVQLNVTGLYFNLGHSSKNNESKGAFLGSADALLMPVQWPEPFGMAAIEALACGTPVIATPRGALPEIITNRNFGFFADPDNFKETLYNLYFTNRFKCREHFEKNFTIELCAIRYLNLYRDLILDLAQPNEKN